MIVPRGKRAQAPGQFASVRRAHHRAVTTLLAGTQQGGGDRVNVGLAVQVPGDRLRVGGDQFFGMGGQQDGHPRVGEPVNGHHATSWSGIDTITWALVPLMPNADTAARRCPSVAGQSVSVEASRNPWLSQSISRLASSVCRLAGTAAFSAAINTLARPSAPAAA